MTIEESIQIGILSRTITLAIFMLYMIECTKIVTEAIGPWIMNCYFSGLSSKWNL